MARRCTLLVFAVIAGFASACAGSVETRTANNSDQVDSSSTSSLEAPSLDEETMTVSLPQRSVAAATSTSTAIPEPISNPKPDSPPSFPTLMATIRGGEEVLLINTTSGKSSVVARFDLGFDPDSELGPQFPFSIDMDSVAAVVRYDTCCDQEKSATLFVDLKGGEEFGSVRGDLPSVSPDGSTLALSQVTTLNLMDTATLATTTISRSDEVWFVGRTSWNPHGSTLAVEIHAPTFIGPVIALVDISAPSFDTAELLQPPPGMSWTFPSFRADGALVVVESSIDGSVTSPRIVAIDLSGAVLESIGLNDLGAIVDIDHDVSGNWLLIVNRSGDAFWVGPTGVVGRLPGGGYSAASW